MGTFVLLFVILLVVLFLIFYAVARNKELKEEELRRKENLKQYDNPEYIKKVKSGEVYPKKETSSAITGYSVIEFEMIKSLDLCDESEELYSNIKEGDFLTCMTSPYREHGEVYVNVGWFEVGTVDKNNRRRIFEKVNAANYLYCQCSKIIEENGAKRHFCMFVFFDSKGTFNLETGMISGPSSATVLSSDTDTQNIDMDNFLWIMPTGQLVSNLRNEYYKCGVPQFGDETEDVLDEDNVFMIQFVKDYLRGLINSVDDKSDFIRECTSSRRYGNSSILKRRISLYIRDTGIEFIN